MFMAGLCGMQPGLQKERILHCSVLIVKQASKEITKLGIQKLGKEKSNESKFRVIKE